MTQPAPVDQTRDVLDPQLAPLYRTLLSHIVTGEQVGIDHYEMMAGLARSERERAALLQARDHERAHFQVASALAESWGLRLEATSDDVYWGNVRAAFLGRVQQRDLDACYVYQDVVIESFAFTLYDAVAPGLAEPARQIVRQIAVEERAHLDEGIDYLGRLIRDDAQRAERLIARATADIARVIAVWMAPIDCSPVCAVCGSTRGSCFKVDLLRVGLSLQRTRARFFSTYGDALRAAGLRPAFVARLLVRLM